MICVNICAIFNILRAPWTLAFGLEKRNIKTIGPVCKKTESLFFVKICKYQKLIASFREKSNYNDWFFANY